MTQQTLISLPTRIRGNHSKNFKTLNVLTNHYSIQFIKNISKIFIFKVIFTPAIPTDNADLRKRLFNELYQDIEKQIANPVFTGYNIYSTEPPTQIQKAYTCKEYNLVIKQVKQYDMSSNPKMLLGFLNNGLRNIMSKLNFVEIGKTGKYFNSKDFTKIDDLIMYNGYKSNFVMLENGYFLRIDPAKKIVRNQTVLQFIDDFYLNHKEASKEQKRNLIKLQLIGKIVMSNYGRTRYHRIIDLQFKEIESIMLENEVSILQYYQQKYKIKIKSLKQPLIVIEGRDKQKPTYLFPELMLMTGIPENFDEFRRKKISERTIKDPSQKMKEIEDLMDKLISANEVKALKQLGLKLNKNLSKIEAKQISTPTLQLGKNNTVEKGRESAFQLFNKPIFSAKHDIPCAIISLRNTDIRGVIQTFQKTGHNLGVKMEINCYTFPQAQINLVQKQIDKSLERGSKICLIVLPVSLKNSYKSIKLSTLKDGVITQCMTEMTLRKKNLQSIATKVLLQIIAKRGNILWNPKLHQDLDFSGMLVGLEQTKIGKSICLTLCATINSTFNMIFSANKHFEGLQNKYSAMSELLLKAIKAYANRNKGVPYQIVCFQNSCPDDQVKLYHQLFITPTIDKVKAIYDNSTIPLTIVMINSKTSERFFVKNNGDRPQNVPAGTLISEGVVSLNYDFYLISQKTTRGTVVPNHYKVIYSDSKMQQAVLQEIAFSQCFNYANWTGSIKVPAVLQYAKKLSKFKSQVLNQQEVPEELSSRLFFI